MSTKRIVLAVVLALSMMAALAYGCIGPTAQQTLLKDTTAHIQKAVQTQLDNLDADMSTAASQLSSTGLSGTDTRNILSGLVADYPFVIDSCTIDTAGKMVTIAPDDYSSYEGTDLSKQAVTIQFWATKKPMLSQRFMAVEGVDSVVIIWPILSQNGEFIGSLSARFQPETLFAITAEPVLQGTGIGLDVMQLDGLNLYDYTGVDTGKNLFTDPELQPFTELVALGHRMVAEESGFGSYTITDHATGQTVKKQVFWTTVSLHGTAWRLVGSQKVAE